MRISKCSTYHPKGRRYDGAWEALEAAVADGRFRLLAVPMGDGTPGLFARSSKRPLYPSEAPHEVEFGEWKTLVEESRFVDSTGHVTQPKLRLWVYDRPKADGQEREAFGLSEVPELKKLRGYTRLTA